MERFEVWEIIYEDSRSKVRVAKGWDRKTKAPVALKIRLEPDRDMLPVYRREAETHAMLNHPNICKFHMSFMNVVQGQSQFVIAMELVATDLHKEIERRWPETFWDEAILWKYLTQATEALSYLQEKVIPTQFLSHRDIKPHNMFLDEHDNIKLGDFGATRRAAGVGEFTLQGSPLYLSPLLRQHMSAEVRNHHSSLPRHNPYKSDVYSLGISFVHLINLRKPSELASTKELSQKVKSCISSLRCSWKLKMVLTLMLKELEEERPDCIQLQELLHSIQKPHPESGLPCVLCGGALSQPIPLFCRPEEHQFCSLQCFKFFVGYCERVKETGETKVFCPQCCDAQIPDTYVLELMGGTESFHRSNITFLRQRDLCSECGNIGSIMRITTCPHQFCAVCLGGWRRYIKEEIKNCPICDQPLKPEARLFLKKRCTLL